MSVPAGWYHDPDGAVRWWDGERWGALAEQVADPTAADVAGDFDTTGFESAEQPSRRPRWPWIVAGAAAVVFIAVAAAAGLALQQVGRDTGQDALDIGLVEQLRTDVANAKVVLISYATAEGEFPTGRLTEAQLGDWGFALHGDDVLIASGTIDDFCIEGTSVAAATTLSVTEAPGGPADGACTG